MQQTNLFFLKGLDQFFMGNGLYWRKGEINLHLLGLKLQAVHRLL